MSNSSHSLPGWSCYCRLDQSQTNFFRCRSLILGAWVLGHMETEKLWRLLFLALHSLCDVVFTTIALVSSGGWESSGRLSLCDASLALFSNTFWIMQEQVLGLFSQRRGRCSKKDRSTSLLESISLILPESTRLSRLW